MDLSPTTLVITVLTSACTGLLSVIVMLLTRKDDKSEREGERRDRRGDRHDDRGYDHGVDLAGLQANVIMLMAERGKCDVISERVSRTEAWQGLMQPRIEEAHEGLRAVARLDERIKTLFTQLSEINQKLPPRPTHAAA